MTHAITKIVFSMFLDADIMSLLDNVRITTGIDRIVAKHTQKQKHGLHESNSILTFVQRIRALLGSRC